LICRAEPVNATEVDGTAITVVTIAIVGTTSISFLRSMEASVGEAEVQGTYIAIVTFVIVEAAAWDLG